MAEALATNAAIPKKIIGLGTTPLIFSNKELNDIMKIIKSLEDSGLLIKGVTEIVENEVKEQKVGFLGMLAATSGASLPENMLARKGVLRAGEGAIRARKGILKASEGNIRAGQDF